MPGIATLRRASTVARRRGGNSALPISASNPTPTITSLGSAPTAHPTKINMPTDGQPHQGFPALHYVGSGHFIAWYRSAARHSYTVRGTLGYGVILQTESFDYGATWSDPTAIVDNDVTMDDARGPGFSVLPDGTWALFYPTWLAPNNGADPPTGCVVNYKTSTDQGTTWTAETRLTFDSATLSAYPGLSEYTVANSGPMIATDGSYILAGTGRQQPGDTVYSAFLFKASSLAGPWTATLLGDGVADDRTYDEAFGREIADGTYLAFGRYGANGICRYTSTDGLTWTGPSVTIPTGASGRPAWIQLANGKILMGSRASDTINQVRLSSDNGATWTAPTDVPPVGSRLATYMGFAETVPGLVGCVHCKEDTLSDGQAYFSYILDGMEGTPPAVLSVATSSSVVSGSNTSVTLNKPSGTTAGDLLILVVNQRSSTATYTAPTGFASLGSQAGTGKLQIWWKIADGTEGSTFAVSSSVSTTWAAGMLRVINAENSAPVAAFANATSTTATTPAATLAESGSLVLAVFAGGNAFQADVVPSTGYTEVMDIRQSVSATSPFLEIGYKATSGTGTEPSATTSIPSQSWMAASVVIRPA